MKRTFLYIFITTILILNITGCSSKQDDEEYNKPAVFWYNKMIKQIGTNHLDEADDTYVSLESEHRKSVFIPNALMIIANAHIDEEEYTMANYYLDLYMKKFLSKDGIDYIRFLKIKSNFLAFKQQYREQKLLISTLLEANDFIINYPDSKYIYLVKDIKARLLMTKSQFDIEISELYERIDKPKAEIFYQNKAKQSWNNIKTINKVDVPWYRAIFE